jgi:hypothetical protein
MNTDAITEGLEVSLPTDTPETQEAELKVNGVDTSQLSLEEIGQKYIVSNLVADELKGILNIVTQTAEQINNATK